MAFEPIFLLGIKQINLVKQIKVFIFAKSSTKVCDALTKVSAKIQN